MQADNRLVGRATQLRQVAAVRRVAASGAFRCILLTGEAGIGKSRLAAELLAGSASNIVNLTARAYPLGETSPMGVWAEAFESHLRTLPPERIVELCGGFIDDLATLCRSIAAVREGSYQADPPRARLLQGMSSLLENLADRTTVQILLDDMHLADSSTWEALHYLSGSTAHSSVLVLATAREAELNSLAGAGEVLLNLLKDGALHTVPVTALTPEQVAELAESVLGHPPEPALSSWLSERSMGNPMFALSLLHALLDRDADLSAPELSSLPAAIAGLVESRLGELDEVSTATLELISVVGQRVDFAELVRLTARPAERLEPVLVKLVHSRLLTEKEVGGRLTYEIAHPLYREAIFDRIGKTRRQSIHRLVGRTLLASGRLGAAAPHFVSSAGIDDREAIDALREAIAQAEEAEAYKEALMILNNLVRLIPTGDPRWMEIVDAFSWQPEWVIDHRADVHASLGVKAAREIDLVAGRSVEPGKQAAVKFRLASFLAWGTGELREAEEHCRQGTELFRAAGDTAGELLTEVELAWLHSLKGQFVEAERLASEVMQRARERDQTIPLMQAVGARGYALFGLGRLDEAETIFRQSLVLAQKADNNYRLTMSYAALGLVLAFRGSVEESLGLLADGRRVYPGFGESVLLEWSALVHWMAGDFRATVDTTQAALAASSGGLSRRRGYALPFAAIACLEMGEMVEAKRLLDKARAVYGSENWSFCNELCGWAEAMLWYHQGQPTQALNTLQAAADRVLDMQAWPWASPILLDLAEVAFESGATAHAARAAKALANVGEHLELDLYSGMAKLAAGWAAMAEDDFTGASRAAESASNLLALTGCQAMLGRALALWGQASMHQDRDEALLALQKAADVFEGCPAPGRRQSVLKHLAHLGSKGRRAAASAKGPESLTPRERQVLELAEVGLTTRQIADQLFISTRTVETHLSNTYAKLGVSSKLMLLGQKLHHAGSA